MTKRPDELSPEECVIKDIIVDEYIHIGKTYFNLTSSYSKECVEMASIEFAIRIHLQKIYDARPSTDVLSSMIFQKMKETKRYHKRLVVA